MVKNKYVVHATVDKYDEGLEAHTRANVNDVFEAHDSGGAIEKAFRKFKKDFQHPKISNIRITIDLINKI